MRFVDTHTHLYDDAYGDCRDDAVQRAVGEGVVKLVFPDEKSSVRDAMFSLARRHPGTVFPCLGLHPTEIPEDWRGEVDALLNYCPDPPIVAVGETGLDFHFTSDNADIQEEVFRIQLDMALNRDLPIIIHSRDATERLLKILRDYRGRGLRGVLHAFGGSYETFREIERDGDFYVGVGGVVTFKKASIAETVKRIPTDRILTETDSPYLTPVPFRGTRNESAYIPIIAGTIARQKGLDPGTFAEAAWDNAHRLFNLEN